MKVAGKMNRTMNEMNIFSDMCILPLTLLIVCLSLRGSWEPKKPKWDR